MNQEVLATSPFSSQQPGTSGLRKKVGIFKQLHYLQNLVQSIFDAPEASGDPQSPFLELIDISTHLAALEHYTDRTAPDVIT